MEIERVTAADLPSIIDIDTRISGIQKPKLWADLIDAQETDDKRSFFVARLNGQVVGYVVGEVRGWEFGSPPCGWLYTIGVRPEYRVDKIGTVLFNALADAFQSQGVETFRTMLHIDDHLLMSFFRAQGLTAGPFVELEMRLDDRD
ncbi:MAG: GNAT family N-acetyltransferase [Hyphomicrobiaceae bacterium]